MRPIDSEPSKQQQCNGAILGEVRISDLTKFYVDGAPILNKINLTIRSGEFFTLLGPSGCGKTTLLRTIVGFLRQDSGTITYDGERIDLQPAYKRNIGMVFQDYAIFPHLSVWKNVAFGLRPRGLSAADTKDRVAEAIHTVRLEGFEDRMPSAPCFKMNAFCASENADAFIGLRSFQPREAARKTLTKNDPVCRGQISQFPHQNSDASPLGYSCIDGFAIPPRHITIERLPPGETRTVELFTDGYFSHPDRFGVAAWEAEADEVERIDPLKIGPYASVKGSLPPVRTDDRTYLGVRI